MLMILPLLWSVAVASDPEVWTPMGRLRGSWMTSRGGRKFMAFRGIPYAKPPVGRRTFEPPEPSEPWTGIKEAKENGPYCIQFNLYDLQPQPQGQRDCLYLSVYTRFQLAVNALLPVLVHFHGGGFISGNGNQTGPEFLMDENVVIVNVNYRLGPDGFLSFEDRDLPGNMGLKDQVMALRWTQQNIASFGGDPNSVTIVGESAGSGSVYHHTISPLSRGLFQRGIAESGTSYNVWDTSPPGYVRSLSIKLLQYVGCNYTTTKAALECLRTRNPNDIVSATINFRKWQIDPIATLGPVLEPQGPGAFLTGPVSSWVHNPVPLLMGTTSAEGLLRTQFFIFLNTSFESYSNNFETIAPISLLYFHSASNPDEITRQVRNFYFQGGNITQDDWVNITNMYSDAWFTIGILDGANNHTGDVHFYYFDYVGDYASALPGNRSLFFGAPHAAEAGFIWRTPIFPNLTGDDLKLSQKLVKIWTDFARYGSPAPIGSGLRWDKWSACDNKYLLIDKSGFHLKEGLQEDRYKFWKSINYRDNYN